VPSALFHVVESTYNPPTVTAEVASSSRSQALTPDPEINLGPFGSNKPTKSSVRRAFPRTIHASQEFFSLWLYLVNLDVGFFDFSSLNSSDYVLML
jgi:hypothetical protein